MSRYRTGNHSMCRVCCSWAAVDETLRCDFCRMYPLALTDTAGRDLVDIPGTGFIDVGEFVEYGDVAVERAWDAVELREGYGR
jgi:hypothetical protein